jgi:hypothetical protein
MKTDSFIIQKMRKGDRSPERERIPSLVLSDTSSRPHRAQTPIPARPFLGILASIITSFFGFSMGIDSSRKAPRTAGTGARSIRRGRPGCAPRTKRNRRGPERDGLANHWAEMLGLGLGQVNEV